MKVTRRELAGFLAAATVVGQTPPQPQADAEVQSARAQMRRSAQVIATVPLPMTTEPSFQFKP